MEVQVAVLCDSASDYRGKLCILGTFDTILASKLPTVHPHCSIALRMVFRDSDVGQHGFKIGLIDEDGKSMLPKIEPAMDVKLPENVFFYSCNLIFNLQQIKFEKPGQYSIDLIMDDRMIARIPLQVMLAQKGY
ncbi:MAG: hypothetical protein AAB466_04855 [Verrucomicrobiota bacterium]